MTSPTITAGGKERVDTASALYKNAFRNDPVLAYMLGELSTKDRHAYLYSYFRALLTAAGLNDARFLEAEDWSSAAVIMPPGKRVDNFWTLLPAGLVGMVWRVGLKGAYRMLGEFGPQTDKMKAKGLKGAKRYYYVFFLATDEKARGRGLSSVLIREAQEMGRKEGLPVWLEATTAYSWRLYEHLGFETVDRVMLGKGVAAADGTQAKGGEGVPIWGMVWRPGI